MNCKNDALNPVKIGVLVGAAPIGSEKNELLSLLNQGEVYKIAADGGIGIFLENGIVPDHWLGDMDSTEEMEIKNPKLSDNPLLGEIKKTVLPCIKDDTDMALGLSMCFEKGCTEVLIFGGTGGNRISHTVANIQLMNHYGKLGKKVVMISENCRMFVLHDSSVKYDETKRGFISIFAMDESAEVSIKGLFYEFEGILTNQKALGVSNEFTGKKSEISVKKGSLLIIEENKFMEAEKK